MDSTFDNCFKKISFVRSVVDAWGKFPPGILMGNSFEPGLFSECFHIDQNGVNYKTQYCIATLMVGPRKVIKMNKVWKR